MQPTSSKGFSHIEIIVALVALGMLTAGGWLWLHRQPDTTISYHPTTSSTPTPTPTAEPHYRYLYSHNQSGGSQATFQTEAESTIAQQLTPFAPATKTINSVDIVSSDGRHVAKIEDQQISIYSSKDFGSDKAASHVVDFGQTITGVEWSTDNSKFAVATQYNPIDVGPGYTNYDVAIYVVNADGSHKKQIYQGKGFGRNLLSFTNNKIYYSPIVDGGFLTHISSFYLSTLKSTDVYTDLDDGQSSYIYDTFSPDATNLYTLQLGQATVIRDFSITGGHRDITPISSTSAPAGSTWDAIDISPDGKYLLAFAIPQDYLQPGTIYQVDITTGKATPFMDQKLAQVQVMTYSPDGKYLWIGNRLGGFEVIRVSDKKVLNSGTGKGFSTYGLAGWLAD